MKILSHPQAAACLSPAGPLFTFLFFYHAGTIFMFFYSRFMEKKLSFPFLVLSNYDDQGLVLIGACTHLCSTIKEKLSDCFLGNITYIPMNLTLKSKSWAGNIFHQFESICQDVDDFMTKDTVRFVENQVQCVGISVKRLYSNVVQDILPLSENIAKPGSQLMEGEQVTTINETQLSENQGSFDNFRNFDSSLPVEVKSGVDENSARVSSPLAAISVFDGEIFSETSVEDCKNSIPIMHEEELITVTTERRDFNDTEMDKRSLSCSTSPMSSNILDFANLTESNGQDNVESNDNAFKTDGSSFVGDLSESEMSRESDTGNTDELVVCNDDLDMEMLDLSFVVKHDETREILNGNPIRAVSHGKRNLRYYKKLVQHALTSRKRLSKEYEHLAIMYGDIDLETSQHFQSNSVPSSPNTSSHAERTQSFHEMSETDWELV